MYRALFYKYTKHFLVRRKNTFESRIYILQQVLKCFYLYITNHIICISDRVVT